MEVMRTPPISGVMNSPETVGVYPLTTCRYIGRKVTDPNSATPTTKPTASATEITRFENSRRGRIASSARRSTCTKTTSNTTPRTSVATIAGDVHDTVVPPKLV